MDRFVSTAKMMDGNLPVLILSSDPALNGFAAYNGFKDVRVLIKNFGPADIQVTISKLLRNRFCHTDVSKPASPVIIGNSPGLLKVKKRIAALSRLNEPLLIQGEPGTGKELVARAVHYQSQRRNSPFVKVNLAEINSGQLDGFVFGDRQKGFQKSTPGFGDRDNPADNGTLFLDEITALPPLLQSRLLNVYEKKPLNAGSLKPARLNAADMTPVVSSSRFLADLVRRGKFRKDLYYRLSVMSIEIPPLRERVSDIAPLTDFFADQLCLEYDVGPIELPREVKDCFYRYPWPGNVRQLKAAVRRAVLSADSAGLIQDLWIQSGQNREPANSDRDIDRLAGFPNFRTYLRGHKNLSLKSVCGGYVTGAEITTIKKALKRTNWNRKKAAALLGISYKSLLNKIKTYGLA
jgi:two-component system response regulator AtoC